MRTGSTRRTAVGVLSALGVCLAAGIGLAADGGGAGTPAAGQAPASPAAQSQTVEISLEDFVARALTNHPDLDFASASSAPATAPRPAAARTMQPADHPVSGRPALAAPLVVRQAKGSATAQPAGAAGTDEARLREMVEAVVWQAVEAYWDQVRRQGDVQICKTAVARAVETTRRFQGNPDANANGILAANTPPAAGTGTGADVPARTVETYLAETRIALAKARRLAGEGQDRLKLILNDEAVSIWSDTRLVLLTEPADPPAGSSLDLGVGIGTAAYVRLDPADDRRDKSARRKYETVALEVKRAYRQSAAARALFALARDRAAAAQKTLDADEAASGGVAAGAAASSAAGAGAATGGPAAPAAAAGTSSSATGARRRSAGDTLLLRLRAEAALADADRQLLSARTDYQTAQAAWQRATGELLDEWNITLQAPAGK